MKTLNEEVQRYHNRISDSQKEFAFFKHLVKEFVRNHETDMEDYLDVYDWGQYLTDLYEIKRSVDRLISRGDGLQKNSPMDSTDNLGLEKYKSENIIR